jgi:hypothetical protein
MHVIENIKKRGKCWEEIEKGDELQGIREWRDIFPIDMYEREKRIEKEASGSEPVRGEVLVLLGVGETPSGD